MPPQNKKLFYGAIVVVAVIVVFTIITILNVTLGNKNNSGNPPQNVTTTSRSENQNNSDIGTALSGSPEKERDWKNYKNSAFSITYPKDWTVEELTFQGGEKGTSIHSITATADNPVMLISTSDSSSSALIQSQKFYEKNGYVKDTIQIGNIQAVKLSGTIPPKSEKPLPSEELLQVKHIYFSKDGSYYLLKYSYIGKTMNQLREKMFGDMVSSFKFNSGQ